tara:strand:- start:6343 stop:6639 length:297 start_codon:yes stop_codon:yes gene_type:complete
MPLSKPEVLLHANASGASQKLIDAPGAQKSIVLVGVLSTAAGNLRETSDSGDIVCYCDDQGWAEWNIRLTENKGLYTPAAMGGNVTVSYWIDTSNHSI